MKPSGILSNPGHEESGANWPGPSGKAKYSRETDSAQYREGKVKRTPDRGVKMACLLHNDPTSCLAWRG